LTFLDGDGGQCEPEIEEGVIEVQTGMTLVLFPKFLLQEMLASPIPGLRDPLTSQKARRQGASAEVERRTRPS